MPTKAIDYAKVFMKRDLDSARNTFDGNMKLQKLLFFADYISLATRNCRLFDDTVYAFRNGCVVESVRTRYKNDFQSLYRDCERFEPDFTEEEYEVINLTCAIFGNLSARELSQLNHSFDFWKKRHDASITTRGMYNKDDSVVTTDDMLAEIQKINNLIALHKQSRTNSVSQETINGVTFYYDNMELTDSIMEQLEEFAQYADEDDYTVYLDNGELVIY